MKIETRPGETPATALYRMWSDALAMYYEKPEKGQAMAFGHPSWGLSISSMDSENRPVISYGQMASDSFYTSDHFDLAADGRFRLRHMWGDYRRTRVAGATFLTYGYTHSRYQWAVKDSTSLVARWNSGEAHIGHSQIRDFRVPISYVSEDLLGVRNWRSPFRWLVLEPIVGEESWRIRPAANQANPDEEPDDGGLALRPMWDHYDKIRRRRYIKFENQWRTGQGLQPLPTRLSARTTRVTENNQPIPLEDAVLRIAAMLDVTSPARSKPLRTNEAHKEAHDGNHLGAAHGA